MPETVTSREFGTLHHDNGRQMRLTQKHKGFDPGQMIEVTKQVNDVKEKAFTTKLEKLQQEQEALVKSDAYLRRFMSAAKVLSNPKLAALKGEQDAFGTRAVSYASDSLAVTGSDVVLVSPNIGANEGSLAIQVDRIATHDRITSSVAQASKTTNITSTETKIYIRGVEVTVPANATLEEIVGAINVKKADSHVSSYAQKFSDTDYRLFLSGTETGEKITFETIVNKLTESFDSNTDPLGLSGTLVIGGEEKVVTSTMNLGDIATLISEVTDFTATVSAGPPYTLDVLKNAVPVTLTNEATEKLFDDLGITESGTLEDDLKAQYYVNGSPTVLQSTTNQIEGLYNKATVSLLKASGGATVTTTVSRDPVAVKGALDEFISTYNDLVTFANELTAKDPKNNYAPKEGAHLAKNRSFVSMMDTIKRSFSAVTVGVTGLSHISEVGISKDDNGLLVANESKLVDTLNSNLQGVEQVFGFISTNVTGGYYIATQHPTKLPSEMSGQEVRVSITKDASSDYSARMYLWDGVTATQDTTLPIGSSDIKVYADGKVNLKGPVGSIYENFVFDYRGPEIGITTEEQGFTFSQGLGDMLEKSLAQKVLLQALGDDVQTNDMNKISSSLQRKQKTLEKQLKEQKTKSARELKRTQRYVERMQAGFAKMREMESELKKLTSNFSS